MWKARKANGSPYAKVQGPRSRDKNNSAAMTHKMCLIKFRLQVPTEGRKGGARLLMYEAFWWT